MDNTATAPAPANADESKPRSFSERMAHMAVSLRKKLHMDTPFMEQNYTRISSTLRLFADSLMITSGLKFGHNGPLKTDPKDKGFVAAIKAGWKGGTRERVMGAGLGIFSSVLGMVFKQQPQSEEELRQLGEMSAPQYVLTRIRQAFNPRQHIRQTLALSMLAGASSGFLAGVRSSRIGECVVAVIAFISGCVLGLTRRDDKAWERQAMTISLATPAGLGYAYESAVHKGDLYVPAAIAMHQVSHAVSFIETLGRKDKASREKDDKGEQQQASLSR